MSLSQKLHSLDRGVFYVAHPIRSIVSRQLPLRSTATLAAVPAMSLAPFAPFAEIATDLNLGKKWSEKWVVSKHLAFAQARASYLAR
jgi:hypothetical protein